MQVGGCGTIRIRYTKAQSGGNIRGSAAGDGGGGSPGGGGGGAGSVRGGTVGVGPPGCR